MSCYTKEQLENMLQDVVNELNLSDTAIEEHGPWGTPPATLVQLVLKEKDWEIKKLKFQIESLQNSSTANTEEGSKEQHIALKELLLFARDITTNWDCDSDSHRYNTPCRACDAKALYKKYQPFLTETKQQ